LDAANAAPDFNSAGTFNNLFPNKNSPLAHAELNSKTGSLLKHYYIPNKEYAFGEYYFYIYARDNHSPATSAAFYCSEKLTLHVCGPRDGKYANTNAYPGPVSSTDDDLLHQNTTSGPVAFPYGAGMTTTPYNKNQLYYSINPDIDSHLTNYFLFPDFDNNDPLCAITNRW
jgi:hypothetical protein